MFIKVTSHGIRSFPSFTPLLHVRNVMSDTEKALDHNDVESDVQHAPKVASSPPAPTVEEPSRFSKNEKWFIVCFTSMVGLFR